MQINDLGKLRRFKDIVTVLVRYGFDEIVLRMELPGSDLVRKIHPIEEELRIYKRIRLAAEEMGPAFVKFGQIMSLSPDLLPKALLDELEKLQDDVPALDFKDIEKMVVTSFGKLIDEVFSVFDVEPLAAASLSQVHRCVLNRGGQIVTVKIKRP
jgi:ubiquinone biosynthesis protein